MYVASDSRDGLNTSLSAFGAFLKTFIGTPFTTPSSSSNQDPGPVTSSIDSWYPSATDFPLLECKSYAG